MKCRYCGAVLENGAKFCTECGERVVKMSETQFNSETYKIIRQKKGGGKYAKRSGLSQITKTLLIILFLCALVCGIHIHQQKKYEYQRAMDYIEKGCYIGAYPILDKLSAFKDAAEQKQNIESRYYAQLIQSGEAGETVFWGSYEQDNNNRNGKEKIEWVILEKTENELLLMSKYALDYQPFHTKAEAVTWKESTLRQWLNGEFIRNAFTLDEQYAILADDVKAEQNNEGVFSMDPYTSYIGLDPGEDSREKVFLLSVNNCAKLFPEAMTGSSKGLVCKETKYAAAKMGRKSNGNVSWWLRSRGAREDYAAYVGDNGYVWAYGGDVNAAYCAVRPVVRISTDRLVDRALLFADPVSQKGAKNPESAIKLLFMAGAVGDSDLVSTINGVDIEKTLQKLAAAVPDYFVAEEEDCWKEGYRDYSDRLAREELNMGLHDWWEESGRTVSSFQEARSLMTELRKRMSAYGYGRYGRIRHWEIISAEYFSQEDIYEFITQKGVFSDDALSVPNFQIEDITDGFEVTISYTNDNGSYNTALRCVKAADGWFVLDEYDWM